MTRAIIGSPPISCKTLARLERIRLPSPAARMMVAVLIVLTEVRNLPGGGVLARRDHPVALEAASVGHIYCSAKEEYNVVGAVGALGLEFVVDDGLASVGVDLLSAGELHLVVNLVERESGAERLRRFQIDRDVILVDEIVDHAARTVSGMASERERRDQNREDVDFSASGKCERSGRRGHDFFLNRSSSLFCAPDFVDRTRAFESSAGVKYSQKLNRSLSTTRSAIGSRQLLL